MSCICRHLCVTMLPSVADSSKKGLKRSLIVSYTILPKLCGHPSITPICDGWTRHFKSVAIYLLLMGVSTYFWPESGDKLASLRACLREAMPRRPPHSHRKCTLECVPLTVLTPHKHKTWWHVNSRTAAGTSSVAKSNSDSSSVLTGFQKGKLNNPLLFTTGLVQPDFFFYYIYKHVTGRR